MSPLRYLAALLREIQKGHLVGIFLVRLPAATRGRCQAQRAFWAVPFGPPLASTLVAAAHAPFLIRRCQPFGHSPEQGEALLLPHPTVNGKGLSKEKPRAR